MTKIMDTYSIHHYEEKLKSGGHLDIYENSWCVTYFFDSFESKNSFETFQIGESNIDTYIHAFKANFEKYKEISKQLPPNKDCSIEVKGECNMVIMAGSFYNGVTFSTNMKRMSDGSFPISTEEQLNQVIEDLEYCKRLATQYLGEKRKQRRELTHEEKKQLILTIIGVIAFVILVIVLSKHLFAWILCIGFLLYFLGSYFKH